VGADFAGVRDAAWPVGEVRARKAAKKEEKKGRAVGGCVAGMLTDTENMRVWGVVCLWTES
jgi:hypothetical protein